METNIHDTSDRKDNHVGNISEALNMKMEHNNNADDSIPSKFYIQFVNQVKNLFSFFKKEKKA